MTPARRSFIRGVGAASVFGVLGFRAFGQAAETVVKIHATKFEYTPREVRVKQDAPIVFELTVDGTEMGFNLPDFKVRGDLVPGQTTRLSLVPDKAGKFAFYCDVFCGSGHEDMEGTLIVE